MLLDETKYMLKPKKGGSISRHTLAHRYTAKRFRFTDETCRAVGGLLKDYPDILLRNYQFALPPFPIMYCEVDFMVLLEAIGRAHSAILKPDGATRVGYLSANGILTSLCATYPEYSLDVMPTFHAYTIDAPPLPPAHRPPGCKQIEFKDDWGTCVVALGSTFSDGNPTQEQVADIHQRVKVWVETWLLVKWNKNCEILQEYVGDVRNWWALMLWLNQPSQLVYDIQPRVREMTKRGPIIHQEHTVIRLRPGKTYHHVAKNYFKRDTPGGHEVRPFFRNFDKTTNCEHDWPIWPDDDNVWQCKKCPQWRVLVSSHKRGDWSRPVKRTGYVA